MKGALTSVTPYITVDSTPLSVNVSMDIKLVNVDADTMIDNCTVSFNATPPGEPIKYHHFMFDMNENGTVSGTVSLVTVWLNINTSYLGVKVTCTNGLTEVEWSQIFTKKATLNWSRIFTKKVNLNNVRFTADKSFLYIGENVTFTVEHDGKFNSL